MTEKQIEAIVNDIYNNYGVCLEDEGAGSDTYLLFHLRNRETLRALAGFLCIDCGLVRMIEYNYDGKERTERNYCVPCEEILYIESFGNMCFPMTGSFRRK